MKEKQEYIDALECITKEYYSTVRFPEETNKFNSYLRLFKGLVNEHFKEKQETNLEHYFEDLLKVGIRFTFINGKIESCDSVMCRKCVFNGDCGAKRFKWLASSYVKPTYKLTQCEYDMLDTIFEKEARFSTVYLIGELKKKGYFENIKCDSKVLVKDILANCEVIE